MTLISSPSAPAGTKAHLRPSVPFPSWRSCSAAGAHAKYLQAQMGHASIRVTLDLYGHLYPDANRTVLRELDRLIDPPGLEL
jgi:integrase